MKIKKYTSPFLVWFFILAIVLTISAYFHWTKPIFVSGTLLVILFLVGLENEQTRYRESYESVERAHKMIFDGKEARTYKEQETYWDYFTILVRKHLNHWPNDRNGNMELFRKHYGWRCDRW